jgi:hypothetical protein
VVVVGCEKPTYCYRSFSNETGLFRVVGQVVTDEQPVIRPESEVSLPSFFSERVGGSRRCPTPGARRLPGIERMPMIRIAIRQI